MFRKILVPVDGSPLSIAAVHKAAALAEKFQGELTLLNVVVNPVQNGVFDPGLVVIPPEIITALEEEGVRILETAAKEVPSGIAARTVQKFGHPAQTILELAREEGYDLIVIGSRGLGEIRGYLLGSVSDRVTHHAPCTVMIVHQS